MKAPRSGFVVLAVLAATNVAAAVFTQAQSQTPPRPAGPSPEALARLQDGHIAMIKEALKLNEAQLKLWAPVEKQLRASFAARQQARAERQQRREQGAERLSLPDRLDRASQRMAQRAERMKAFAEAFRPFYASLIEDQKAVAGVVLRLARGDRGFRGRGWRWSMQRAPGAEQK